MRALRMTMRMGLRRAGFIALACGLPLAGVLQAQSSSSSNSNYQYNGNNQQLNGNRKTPRYTGHSWTDHLVLEGGGGVTIPAGSTQNTANTGWNVLLGAGFKFNDRLSVLAEWNFNRMGVPHSLAAAAAQTPNGNEHLWTADLNPKFNFVRKGRMDGYVIGGGGFSRALTNFTVPILVGCGYGYGYGYGYGGYGGACTANETVAHTSSNQANLDLGVGGEFRFSPYSRPKLFVEARYVKLFTPRSSIAPGQNAMLVPVTIGVRW